MAIVDSEYITTPSVSKVYERIGTLPVPLVVEALQKNESLFLPNGTDLGILNARMQTYAYQQHCSYTNVPVAYFAIERCHQQPVNPNHLNAAHQYHLNAYALIQEVEVMVNSDHIIPKSKSGVDSAINRQPMIQWANTCKGNDIFFEDIALADKRGVWDMVSIEEGLVLREKLLASAKPLSPACSLDALVRHYIDYRVGDRVKPRKGQVVAPNGSCHNSGVIEDIQGTTYYDKTALVMGKWYPITELRKVFSN